MNPLFERLMRRATHLTQGGNLEEATQAIQRALGAAGLTQPPQEMRATGDVERQAVPAHGPDSLVVDVEARVIDRPSVQAFEVGPDLARPESREADPAVDQWSDGVFTHQHRQLAYKLFVPAKGHGEARPLVLMLHGCTQNPEDFATGTRMNQLAREHGFLVLYPAQTQHANASKCWNWFKPQHQQRGRGEPALLAALTQSIVAAQSADPDRVYVAGLSAGGAMADILGRSYPDVFAAAGVHSGLPAGAAADLVSALAAMQNGPAAQSTPGAVIPTIVFHGDADTSVHARNGEALVAAARDGRGLSGTPAQLASGRSPGGRAFTRKTHLDAQGLAMVEHWQLHGAGHAWSGGHAAGSYTDPSGPDASAEMLRFFLAHRRAADPGPR
jgi:poly(hydroxyalkanoate) depolymerase family esterase